MLAPTKLLLNSVISSSAACVDDCSINDLLTEHGGEEFKIDTQSHLPV